MCNPIDPNPQPEEGGVGDFLLPELLPGEIHSIRWRETAKPVSRNAYRIGLQPHVRESLLQYCDCMGITQILKDKLRYDDQTLDRPEVEPIRLQGKEWLLQCSPSRRSWKSNMHWISPADDTANQAFLRALGAAGFDDVLHSIGEYFGFVGLVAYHPSIIAVSHCESGTIHVDATQTGGKVMNVIIPLLLATDTAPELHLQDEGLPTTTHDNHHHHMTSARALPVGKLPYQHNVAALLGDEVFHATAAVCYTPSSEEIRMAATVYVADISQTNIVAAMDKFVTYPGHYPPPSQPQVLLRAAGAHWQRDDTSKKLPGRKGYR